MLRNRLFFKQVDDLKSKLAAQEKELAVKNEEANKLIAVVGAETAKVSAEKAVANEEERKVKVITEDVTKKQKECEIDLMKAEPALLAAKAALDTLNKVRAKELTHSPQSSHTPYTKAETSSIILRGNNFRITISHMKIPTDILSLSIHTTRNKKQLRLHCYLIITLLFIA